MAGGERAERACLRKAGCAMGCLNKVGRMKRRERNLY